MPWHMPRVTPYELEQFIDVLQAEQQARQRQARKDKTGSRKGPRKR